MLALPDVVIRFEGEIRAFVEVMEEVLPPDAE